MRYLTAGDSHGEYLVAIVEGFPAGHKVSIRAIERDLARRRQPYGRSARQKIESDTIDIVGGLWKGRTTGAPIAILINNTARKVSGKPGGGLGSVPRPGHTDLAGCLKYGLDEVPPVAERASARGTALWVAVGALAKGVLKRFSVDILGHVISIGDVDAEISRTSLAALRRRIVRSPVYCADKKATDRMIDLTRRAKKAGHSLGGAAEVIATGVVPGLGSHVDPARKLSARLAAAMMGIHSVKAVEIGDGLQTYRKRGHEAQDAIQLRRGRVYRATNYAGGIEGGISNGEDVIARLFAKPIPTSLERLPSFDMKRMSPARSPFVRSDVCVLPALSVIAESVMAWELLAAMTEKFGCDTIDEMSRNHAAYLSDLARRGFNPRGKG